MKTNHKKEKECYKEVYAEYSMGENLNYEELNSKLNFIISDDNLTTPELLEERNKLIDGNFINICFLGRYGNNTKFFQTYFLNQNIFEESQFECIKKRKLSNCSNENDKFEIDIKVPFFSNLRSIDILPLFFSNFKISPTFKTNFEFKTDLFCDDYENCIQLDLPEMSTLLEQLCTNDIVIYCTDKTNENILKEANFFEYLLKKSSFFRECILCNKFYIILNNHIPDSGIYKYQNEEAKRIFDRFNSIIGVKFVYDIDIEKSYEEKIIYFSLILKQMNNKELDPENGISHPNLLINLLEKQNVGNSRNLKLNYIKKLSTSSIEEFSHMEKNFREVMKKKFRILNSKNFNLNCISHKYETFVDNFSNNQNYFSYELNIIKEFDKVLYDSLITKLDNKITTVYNKILLHKQLNKMNICSMTDMIKEKRKKIEQKIKETFDYVQKEINKDVNYFEKKFTLLINRIENLPQTIKETKCFKGNKRYLNNRVTLISEIFDVYGLNHHFTTLSIEAVNCYYKYFKKLYLSLTKKISLVNVSFHSLENYIVTNHKEFIDNLNNCNDIKIPFNKTEQILKDDLKTNLFFNLLLHKIFSLNSVSFKPYFAIYNVTNLLGLIATILFVTKGIRKYFKFDPKYKKIFKYLFYAIITMTIFSTFSFLLNKIYNLKSENKLKKLSNQIKINSELIKSCLLNYSNKIEEFKNQYKVRSQIFMKTED